MKSRAVIIHELAHAKAALSAAWRLGKEVTLLSAPSAAAYLGAAVFREMVLAASQAFPGASYRAVLDCGGDAGLALGALRQGIKWVRIEASPEVTARIAGIAAKTGAALWREDAMVLDLLDADCALQACLDWLGGKERG